MGHPEQLALTVVTAGDENALSERRQLQRVRGILRGHEGAMQARQRDLSNGCAGRGAA